MNSLKANNPYKIYMIIGTASLLLAVCFGAMGAHAIKPILSIEQLQSFETGIRYQFIHGLVILFLPALNPYFSEKDIKQASLLFTLGIVLFSFSIYLLNLKEFLDLSGLKMLGPITPLGGLLLISGWLRLFVPLVFDSKNN
ncbi:MAG: uncharacterized membrane protein YgdD (TMEM256/DUF423 family) [Salibacteraceae bacterium]|jgi:uncharacterized membrane protein YgdD (TMEM256/DUF423 family)|tara:strand:+ start:8486 stop:8908 length:423 start_codon:yes stop_codon:yes gene_type:complete